MPIVLSGKTDENPNAVDQAEPLEYPEEPEAEAPDAAAEDAAAEPEPEPEPEPDGIPIDPVADHKADIADTSARVAKAALYLSQAQGEAKSAKKRFETAVEDLQYLVDRGPNELPLFEQPIDGQVVNDTPPSEADDTWEARSIDELSLPTRITNALDPIVTIGQLVELQTQISLGHDRWPKGIAVASITMIEERMIDWLDDNQPKQDATNGEETEEEDS